MKNNGNGNGNGDANGNGKLTTVGTKYGDEELRQWLEDWIEAHPHLTTAILGHQDQIGLSRTLLDDYLAGTYFLDKEAGGKGVKRRTSEDRIRAYRQKVEGVITLDTTIPFVETIAYQRLCMAWDRAISQRQIIVAYNDPGAGKTHPIQQLLHQRMKTMPIMILCSRNITTGYFVQKLAEAVGLSPHHSIPRLEDMIADKLIKNPRGIIVDQANYLSERGLGTICHIWERARVGILLTGTEDLYKLFTTSNMTQDVRAQLTSRVAWHVYLSKLSLKEGKAILQRALGKDISDENVAQIMSVTGGSFRSVTFIVPEIKRLREIPDNKAALKSGSLSMSALIDNAGSRLMLS
jgi:DNA transposition AAA+ family ATPase